MAASAKMSFNYYQNGKYGTIPTNPQKDAEVTQDMHLKMSKKIAQLTKVCYLYLVRTNVIKIPILNMHVSVCFNLLLYQKNILVKSKSLLISNR